MRFSHLLIWSEWLASIHTHKHTLTQTYRHTLSSTHPHTDNCDRVKAMGKRISRQVELSHNYNRTGSRTNVGSGTGREVCQRDSTKGRGSVGVAGNGQLSRLSDVTDYSTQLHCLAVCLAAFTWNTVLVGAYNVLRTSGDPYPPLLFPFTPSSRAICLPHWAAKRLSNCNNTKCNWIHAANTKWSSLHWVSVFVSVLWMTVCELAVCACASNNCKCNNKSHCTPMTNWSSCSSWVLCDCRQRRNVFPATTSSSTT